MSFMIDILHEEQKKLVERVLTMESALTKTKKELLETKKEVEVQSTLVIEVQGLKPRDQTIGFFFPAYNSTVFSTIDMYQFESDTS